MEDFSLLLPRSTLKRILSVLMRAIIIAGLLLVREGGAQQLRIINSILQPKGSSRHRMPNVKINATRESGMKFSNKTHREVNTGWSSVLSAALVFENNPKETSSRSSTKRQGETIPPL